MAYHTQIAYKKKSKADVKQRTIVNLSADEQAAVDVAIANFITKFKEKHLS
jgi:hypothetical protein